MARKKRGTKKRARRGAVARRRRIAAPRATQARGLGLSDVLAASPAQLWLALATSSSRSTRTSTTGRRPFASGGSGFSLLDAGGPLPLGPYLPAPPVAPTAPVLPLPGGKAVVPQSSPKPPPSSLPQPQDVTPYPVAPPPSVPPPLPNQPGGGFHESPEP